DFSDSIHIAVVGPLTGDAEEIGRSMQEGAERYAAEVNEAGGVAGHRLIVQVYDDENKPEAAKAVAERVVNASEALAVVGHWAAAASTAAGDVYNGTIPAINIASVDAALSDRNIWYFNTIFRDAEQVRF